MSDKTAESAEVTTLTVDLGDQKDVIAERMATGHYASPSEVVQEALQALEREDELIEEIVEVRMQGAMDDADPASQAGDAAAAPGGSRTGP